MKRHCDLHRRRIVYKNMTDWMEPRALAAPMRDVYVVLRLDLKFLVVAHQSIV
jgi:hypothetical protein